MKLARALAGCAVLAALLLLSTDGGVSQEKKEKSSGKVTGQLPPGWKDLNLTAAQKEEVYKLNADYKARVDALEDEIKKMKAELVKKRLAVLTDAQRKKLRDTVGGDVGEATAKDAPKTKEKTKE